MAVAIRDKVAAAFGFRGVPFSSRVIFRREFFHMLAWGFGWGSLNGRFCGYIAIRSLGASAFLASLIGAAMPVATLFSVYWGTLTRRWPVKRLMMLALVGLSLVLASTALTPLAGGVTLPESWKPFTDFLSPQYPVAATLLTLQILIAWVGIQAVNTFRINIWRVNYPGTHRGRILGRFAVWQILIAAAWAAFLGTYLDGVLNLRWGEEPFLTIDLSFLPGAGGRHTYAIILVTAGVFMLLSMWLYRKVPVRGRLALEDAEEFQPRPRLSPGEQSYQVPGWFSALRSGVRQSLSSGYRVLANDPVFRKYMIWQFIAGSTTMMIEIPFVIILDRVFEMSYTSAAGVLMFIPQGVLVLMTPWWAKKFDRWDIFTFRSVQMSIWILNRIFLAIGVWQRDIYLVVAGVALSGVAFAGGRFAWQLGHMYFSSEHDDALYMGVHQTLTGIRGLTMPFLGAFLYLYVFDWHIIWISGALYVIPVIGFWRMRRYARNAGAVRDGN